MNVTLDTLSPLPDALAPRGLNGPGRRYRIGDHEIDSSALQHFNELLHYLDLRFMPLDRDQIASAARELVDRRQQGLAPACIHQRMRRAAAIDLMVGDADWETDVEAEVAAHLAVEYLRHDERRPTLIPNTLPVVGRLDDAIVVETAWPTVADEVRNYLDFCRIRHVEAGLRGGVGSHFGFTREDWRGAREAEAEWIAHCQRVGRISYVMADSIPRFRVN